MINKKFNLKKVLLLGLVFGASVHECSWSGLVGRRPAKVPEGRTDAYITKLAAPGTAFQKVTALPKKVLLKQDLINELGPDKATGWTDDVNNFINDIKGIAEFVKLPNQFISRGQGEKNKTKQWCYVQKVILPFNVPNFRKTQAQIPLEKYSIDNGTFGRDTQTLKDFIRSSVLSTDPALASSTVAIFAIRSLPCVVLSEIKKAFPDRTIKITKYLQDECLAYGFSDLNRLYQSLDKKPQIAQTGVARLEEGFKQDFDQDFEKQFGNRIVNGFELSTDAKQKNHVILVRIGEEGIVHVAFQAGNLSEYKDNIIRTDEQYNQDGTINGTITLDDNLFDGLILPT